MSVKHGTYNRENTAQGSERAGSVGQEVKMLWIKWNWDFSEDHCLLKRTNHSWPSNPGPLRACPSPWIKDQN